MILQQLWLLKELLLVVWRWKHFVAEFYVTWYEPYLVGSNHLKKSETHQQQLIKLQTSLFKMTCVHLERDCWCYQWLVSSFVNLYQIWHTRPTNIKLGKTSNYLHCSNLDSSHFPSSSTSEHISFCHFSSNTQQVEQVTATRATDCDEAKNLL